METENGRVTGLRAVRMELGAAGCIRAAGSAGGGGSEFIIAADQVVKAVGQEKPSLAERLGLAIDRGYIRVNARI